MFQPFRKPADEQRAIARIQAWTRERFGLSDDAVILVAEINCQVPGCPPVETVTAFWDGDETRYRYKVFKPVKEVTVNDLPVRWLLPALVDEDDLGCDCC